LYAILCFSLHSGSKTHTLLLHNSSLQVALLYGNAYPSIDAQIALLIFTLVLMLMSTQSMDEYVEDLTKRKDLKLDTFEIPDVTQALLRESSEENDNENDDSIKEPIIRSTASGIEKGKLEKATKRLRNLAYTLQIATIVEFMVQYIADLLRSFDFESPMLLICRIYFICWGVSLCVAAVCIVRLTRKQIIHIDKNILLLSRSNQDVVKLKELSKRAFVRVASMVPLVFLACVVVILWGLDILISNVATYEGYVAAIVVMFSVDSALVACLCYRVLFCPFEFSVLVDETSRVVNMRKIVPAKQVARS
jgi:hypothetical protein